MVSALPTALHADQPPPNLMMLDISSTGAEGTCPTGFRDTEGPSRHVHKKAFLGGLLDRGIEHTSSSEEFRVEEFRRAVDLFAEARAEN